ncbi:MAG: energy-coupling factor ABC transporter permease [Acidobacteria bacterium]|nr:energy-coupling factor ABC transporter permease [Acidobacteriota bacterium]
MHIPDGFLSTAVWATAGAVSVPSVAYLARKSHRALDDGQTPLMGVMGAFVFAAQMINFPVGIGTSGHLVGGALLAVTLGPAAASIVMTAILTVQALLFQDGGVLALGANVFNMAIAGVLAGYLPYRYWGGSSHRKAAIFSGGFLSVFVSACLAMGQLLLSGVPMPRPVTYVSLGLFAVSALIEGGITVAVAGALERLNPSWVRAPEEKPRVGLGLILVAAMLLVSLGALFASSLPDGLERLAENLGIAGRARNLFETPLADYQARFLATDWVRKAVAGLVGLGVVYAACMLIGRAVTRRAAVSRSG